MTTPLAIRNTNQELYTRALSSAYQLFERLYPQDYAESKDADIWEIVRRDPKFAQAIDQRIHAIAGRDWRVEAATEQPQDQALAALVEDALREIKDFAEARKKLAQAVFKARTHGFIESRRKHMSLGDSFPQEWRVPTVIKSIDHRRFRLVPHEIVGADGKKTKEVKRQLWSVDRTKFEDVQHPELFIHVVYNDEESRLGYGRGLLDSMYFYHWIKQQLLKEGLQGVERWAQGIVVAKIDEDREASTDKTNEFLRNELLDALNEMRSRHVVAVGKNDEVNVVTGGGEGNSIVMDMIRYVDDCVLGVALGAVLPFGGGESVGSNARAKEEGEKSESLIQYDRDKLSEDLTDDLVGWFLASNRPQLAMVGLADAKPPRFTMVQEQFEDPLKNTQIAVELKRAGIPLRRDEVYRKTGFTQPKPGDETFEGDLPQPALPGFGVPAAPPGAGQPLLPFSKK